MAKKQFPKTKVLSFFVIALLVTVILSQDTRLHAQQPTDSNQVPSDLSLDLNLAQQNPAPDQQQIAQSETKQVEITTTTGQTTVMVPQDKVAPQVKVESKQEAVNPDQTTSGQVVTEPVQVEADQNGTPIPTESEQNTGNQPTETQSENNGTPQPTQTLVPGTDVVQPDDNAAPTDNSGNPNLPAPTQAPDVTQSTDQPTGTLDINQQNATTPILQQDNATQNSNPTSIPQDNTVNNPTDNSQPTSTPVDNSQIQLQNNSQPTSAPTDKSSSSNPNTAPQQQSQPVDNSSNPPAQQPATDTNTTGGSDTTTSVQGASTGPNPISAFLKNIWRALFGAK